MARPSLPQFEPDYDFYKMRQLVDEMNRWIDTVEAGESGATPPPVTGVHNDLTGRSAADAHPISAITGLTASLAGLATDIASNTATIGAHIADSTIHFTEGSIDHGSIAGLGDDDHPQYGQIATAEDVTGAWTFRHPLEIRALEVGTTPPVPGDNFNAELRFFNITGVNQIGEVGYNGISGNLLVNNLVHGGNVILGAEDAAGVAVIGLNFDPDAALTLTGDTGAFLTGGKAAGELLTLQGSSSSPDVGIVLSNSPITIAYNTIDNTTPAESFAVRWNPTATISALYVGGFLTVAPVFTVTTGVYIPATFSDTSSIFTAAVPGFSAFTFINELAVIRNSGNFNLPSALVANIGLTHERNTAGTSTTPGTTGLSFSPQTRSTISGGIMTKTDQVAVRCSPSFSTVAGATANLGVIRGLHCFNPAVALFQPGAGAESMVGYIGVDVNAIPFGGNVLKVALRSALLDATFTRFIQNIGTAQSEFGAGDIHLNDNTAVKFGATLAASDMMLFWNTGTSALRFSPFFGTAGNPLDLVGTAADEWVFQADTVGFGDIGIGFDVNAVVFGTTLPTPNSNNWFVQFAGPNLRAVQIAGEYSDVLWTASGTIDVNGFAVSDLQAFKINSVSTILNGGTIANISNLYVQAMASANFTTSTQALRVLGRARIDGHINQGSQSPAQLTANTNDWQLAPNNAQRGVVLLTTDGLGPYNVTGIDAAVGRAQIGDYLEIINISVDTITFTHQDVLSLAANRFITATGAGIAVGPNESIRFWYDDIGTLRWHHVQEQ